MSYTLDSTPFINLLDYCPPNYIALSYRDYLDLYTSYGGAQWNPQQSDRIQFTVPSTSLETMVFDTGAQQIHFDFLDFDPSDLHSKLAFFKIHIPAGTILNQFTIFPSVTNSPCSPVVFSTVSRNLNAQFSTKIYIDSYRGVYSVGPRSQHQSVDIPVTTTSNTGRYLYIAAFSKYCDHFDLIQFLTRMTFQDKSTLQQWLQQWLFDSKFHPMDNYEYIKITGFSKEKLVNMQSDIIGILNNPRLIKEICRKYPKYFYVHSTTGVSYKAPDNPEPKFEFYITDPEHPAQNYRILDFVLGELLTTNDHYGIKDKVTNTIYVPTTDYKGAGTPAYYQGFRI